MAGPVAPDRWRASLVRPAGGGDARRPGDVVRLLAGAVGAAVVYAFLEQAPWSDNGLTAWFAALGADQPWIGTTARVLLVVVVPVLVAAIAVVTRSWRLLVSAALATFTAAVVVAALAPVTDPSASRQHELDALGVVASFPLLGVAMPVAILTIGGAFLARPAYRLLFALTAVGIAAVVVGADALVLDVVASALAGWAAAGLAGLVFGAPVGDATPDEVAGNLAALGLDAADLEAVGHPVWGTARFRGRIAGQGPIVVDVHGREAQDARALQRVGHALADKNGAERVAVDRRSQAEHEALCLTLAGQAGVPVPSLAAVGAVGAADDGYVVVRDDRVRPLRSLADPDVADDTLAALWRAVARLRAAGLAHGLLDGDAIGVATDGSVRLTDWFAARPAAPAAALDLDVATVLLVTAAATTPERAVAAAVAGVGPDAVHRALPLCQLGVLDRRSRRDVGKQVAADLRAAAAAALAVEPPELVELHRVSVSDLLMAGGTVLGFWLLYNQLASLGDIRTTIAGADWWWVGVVLVLAQLSVFFTAVGLRAAVTQSLPLARVVALEYADLFTGLLGGTLAITATNIRFFQRQGLPGASAVTAGVSSSLAGGAIQAVIMAASLPLLISSGRLQLGGDGSGGGGATVLVWLLLGAAVVSGAVALVPRFRRAVARKVKPQVATALVEVRELARRPRNLATMFGGALASQVVLALALGASLQAFGGSLPFWDLLVINTFAALIGGLAPVPGGMGAVEAGLIAGFTAFGVDATLAGAATFTYRLFTAYLPPAWGWPTLAWLRRREYL